jgi:hypothetical protein
MQLDEALTQIHEIQRHIARTEVFRGYRSVPTAFSGCLALAAGGYQALWITEPLAELAAYLTIWIGAALVALIAVGAEMTVRLRYSTSCLARQMTILAIAQFTPCLVVGGLVTAIIAGTAAESAWMLPGFYQLLFGLGVFASYRLLPRAVFWVAVFYVASGVLCLLSARGQWALSPWAMAVPFGAGQFLAAGILYWTLERDDHDTAS